MAHAYPLSSHVPGGPWNFRPQDARGSLGWPRPSSTIVRITLHFFLAPVLRILITCPSYFPKAPDVHKVKFEPAPHSCDLWRFHGISLQITNAEHQRASWSIHTLYRIVVHFRLNRSFFWKLCRDPCKFTAQLAPSTWGKSGLNLESLRGLAILIITYPTFAW